METFRHEPLVIGMFDSIYWSFDKKGLLKEKIISSPILKWKNTILYKDTIKKVETSNYDYFYKDSLLIKISNIDTIIEIDTKNHFKIIEINKYQDLYFYDSKGQLITLKSYGNTTDTLGHNSKEPFQEFKIYYKKNKIQKVEWFTFFRKNPSSVWEYTYNRNQILVKDLKNPKDTRVYTNCSLKKETFVDEYSSTEILYNKNGNLISKNIKYSSGNNYNISNEYNTMGDISATGQNVIYIYKYDKNGNWINQKTKRLDTNEIFLEIVRVINYY